MHRTERKLLSVRYVHLTRRPDGVGTTTFVRAVGTSLRPNAETLYVDGIGALRNPAGIRGRIVAEFARRLHRHDHIVDGDGGGDRGGRGRRARLRRPAPVPSHSPRGGADRAQSRRPCPDGLGACDRREALLGHSTGYYVGLSLIWAAAIFVVFGLLAVLRFARR